MFKKFVTASTIALSIATFSMYSEYVLAKEYKTLKEGMKSEEVRQLQINLGKLGFKVTDNPTQYYGSLTKKAVSNFQKTYHLPVTGVATPDTLQKIDLLLSQKTKSGTPQKTTTVTGRTLKEGMNSEEVRQLQINLGKLGFKVVDKPTTYYGELTKKAVMNFQKAYKLPVTGIADENTLAKIESLLSKSNNNSTNSPQQTGKQYVVKGTVLSITGKGFGHLVGLSQWGAKGMAEQGFNATQIIKHYYRGVNISKVDTSKKMIRVALNLSTIKTSFSATASYFVIDNATGKILLSASKNAIANVKWRNSSMEIEIAGKTIKTNHPIKVTTKGLLQYKGLQYEGDLHLKLVSNGIHVINSLPVEAYLKGVVPSEMPAGWPLEALKAQTLAARTYALKSINPYRDFDVYDTVLSQVYKGVSGSHPNTNRAIKETAGQVILYQGKYIDAVFFSSSGGYTRNAEEVWKNKVPYLVGVNDPYDKSPYALQDWTYSLSSKKIESIFPQIGRFSELEVITNGKLATKIIVRGNKGKVELSTEEFRSKIGIRFLPSNNFVIRSNN